LIAAAEGGAVVCHDREFAADVRHLRSHAMVRQPGTEADYQVDAVGFNFRLSDLHAALGRSQLRRIEEKLATRRALAAAYEEGFDGIDTLRLVTPPAGARSAWHLASITVPEDRRWGLIEALRSRGIGAAHHYPAAHLQPVYATMMPGLAGTCPGAERYCASQVTLPLFESLRLDQVRGITEAVIQLLA
jgi:dTDP-4-amino-4,6-dideoxygalactose transaminase